ncbi:MAG: hypothetical protein PHS45_01905 [Bacilli bacterium]|nr:hypothetical protein [Bacilli bacterium]
MILLWSPVTSVKQVLFSIDTTVYKFVGDIYDFLINLAQVQFFRTEQINNFYTRLYVLVGIIMLFRIVFILMGIVVNPGRAFHEKEGTAIPMASRVVTTIVLILVVPYLFSLAYRFQSVILEEGVIGRLITGVAGTTPIGEEVFIKAEKCTYDQIPGSDTGFYWIMSPFIYDLGLAPSANSIQVKNTTGGDITAYSGFSLYAQNDYKTAIFTNIEGVRVINGVRVCSPYAYVYVTEMPFLIDGSKEMRATASIILSNTVGRGWFRSDSNFELIDREASIEGTYKLTAGRSFGAQLLSNFVISDPNDHADFQKAITDADFENMETIINNSFARRDNETRYYLLLSTLTGMAIMLLLVSSCFDIALRTVKLGFLQLTAPIPIATYMEGGRQGGSTFNRWVKVVTGTYFDVFIRVAALSFVTYILNLITQEGLLTKAITTPDGKSIYHEELIQSSGWLLQIFIIFGLFMFIKAAPKMVGDIFNLNLGDTGNFLEFNPFKKMQATPVLGTLTGGVLGAAGGYAVGAGTGGIGGAIRGILQGAYRGAQSIPLRGREFDRNSGVFEGFRETFRPAIHGGQIALTGNRVSSARRELGSVGRATSVARGRYTVAETEARTARESLDRATANVENIRGRGEERGALYDRTGRAYGASQDRFNRAQTAYTRTSERYSELKDRLKETNESHRQLNVQYDDLNRRLEEARGNPNISKDERLELNRQLGVTVGKRDNIEIEREQLEREGAELREALTLAKEEVRDAYNDRSRKRDELIDAGHEAAIEEDRERTATTELREAEEEYTERERDRARLDEIRKEKEEELKRAEAKLKEAEGNRERRS